MKLIYFVLALFISSEAFAEYIRWVPPTTREDGTVLDPNTELEYYRLYCSGRETIIPSHSENNAYPIDKGEMLPSPGTHDCYLTAVDTDGLESKPSNIVQVEWVPSPPSEPTQFILVFETYPPPVERGPVAITVDPFNMDYMTSFVIENNSGKNIVNVKFEFTNAQLDTFNPSEENNTIGALVPDVGQNNDELKFAAFALGFSAPLANGDIYKFTGDLDNTDDSMTVKVTILLDGGVEITSSLDRVGDTDDSNSLMFYKSLE